MDSQHQQAVEQRVAEEGEQQDHAPVARPDPRAESPGAEAHQDQHEGRHRAAEGGEGEGREEELRRLDRGVAAAPDQDDEDEDRDDGGVGWPPSRGLRGQRVFMSSGKLDENE